ncbi:MAG: hypothetical protein ACLQIB_19415 [Isosphaeraceae bacterium]
MSEVTGRPSTRLEPEAAWTLVTDSPLKGLTLAREAGTILVWDEGNQLYLFDRDGESHSISRVPNKIQAGTISDDGSLIALVVDADEAWLMLLDADFNVAVERAAPSEATSIAVDPHGRYLAVGTRLNAVHFINRFGRPAGRLETTEPLSHLCFVPDRALVLGAAAFGMLIGIALEPGVLAGKLEAEIVWQDRLMSNVGRLAVNGDGAMILASCFTLGVQRFDLHGRNEGSYHLGGTVSQSVSDFPGRTIAASTLEGDLAVMNSAGNVRWRTRLSRPVVALEIDPLGRYLIYGHATGELVRLNLFRGAPGRAGARAARRPAPAAGQHQPVRPGGGSVRTPDWLVKVVESDQQAETAVITVQDDPPRVALFTSPHRLQLFKSTGEKPDQGPEMTGVGRILRTAPGWLAAATDRQIVLWDLRRDEKRRVDVSLVELTHLAIKPDDYGLALVQERDRIGRLTTSSRWIWKHELQAPVEDLAIGPGGSTAVTTNGGQLLVFDPAGEPKVGFTFDPDDPPLLIDAPENSAPDIAWISLARRAQWLRGHGPAGEVVWELPMPWEGWALLRVGRLAVVSAVDGRAMTCDAAGIIRDESPPSGEASDVFCLDADGEPVRISRRGVHLICASLDGRVRWRSVVDEPFGPLAAAAQGTAVLIGKSLAWFKNQPPSTRD